MSFSLHELNVAVHKDDTPSRVIDMIIEHKFETRSYVLTIKQENYDILNQFYSVQETKFTLKTIIVKEVVHGHHSAMSVFCISVRSDVQNEC